MRSAATRISLLILLALTGDASASPAAVPQLAAHRAVYSLSLAHAETKAGLNDVQGKLVLEVAGSACEGWTSNMRVVNRLDSRTGKVSLLDTRSSSWESGPGDSMEFTTQRFVNGEQELDLRGRAEHGENGGVVRLELPQPSETELPAGTVFPVEHTRRILAAALNGNKRDSTMVYDGNEDQQVLTAITFIGNRNAPNTVEVKTEAKGAAELPKLASWPVTIGYFKNTPDPDADGEQMPEHQVSFTMFENSVATDLILDYGDFTLKGDLIQLDFLPQDGCPTR
ncbi:cell envelope integrity EipB family protein [Rhodoligotrophos defluvii]|uniref:cell envelope integrity EipB family protein n=1 Tax=Rhodoligotrophos defluvii TaxID=2561934 RepID=UPI001485425A|nr:cell envelope integrity EipB family protein [Rhodoligotrophos defluvii]